MSNALPTTIAYFSMEICLDQAIPTYSGGLGVLAGDTLRSAADLKLPVVGVTLLHRKGYFSQQLDAAGNQTEGPVEWKPEAKSETWIEDGGASSSISTILRNWPRASSGVGKVSRGRNCLITSPTICALGSMTRSPRRMRCPSSSRAASGSVR